MKKNFCEPELAVLHMESNDVICTSGGCGLGGNEVTVQNHFGNH